MEPVLELEPKKCMPVVVYAALMMMSLTSLLILRNLKLLTVACTKSHSIQTSWYEKHKCGISVCTASTYKVFCHVCQQAKGPEVDHVF